jgi:DNA-directed RNA polymerase specialized sigma subunit
MPELYNPHLGPLEELVEKHRNYVVGIATKNIYKARERVDLDDLIQAGMIGLIKAYRRYQPSKEAKFESYAYFQIKKEILAFIRDHSECIKPARDVYEIAGSIIKQQLEELTPEEISKKLHCTTSVARRALKHLDKNPILSLNESITTTEGAVERIEFLDSYQDYTQVFVNDFMDRLNQTDLKMLELLTLDMTQRQIGSEFGISQTHAGRMVKKLRSQAIEYFWSDVAWIG